MTEVWKDIVHALVQVIERLLDRIDELENR